MTGVLAIPLAGKSDGTISGMNGTEQAVAKISFELEGTLQSVLYRRAVGVPF